MQCQQEFGFFPKITKKIVPPGGGVFFVSNQPFARRAAFPPFLFNFNFVEADFVGGMHSKNFGFLHPFSRKK